MSYIGPDPLPMNVPPGANIPINALDPATQALINGAVQKSGGTMSGALILSNDPSNILGAVTKQYSDKKVFKTGDTMTGQLTVASVDQNCLNIYGPSGQCVEFKQGNVYYHISSGNMSYVAKNQTTRWGWDEGNQWFYTPNSFYAGGGDNRGMFSGGSIELSAASYDPYIDFSGSVAQDFAWRIQYEKGANRLLFSCGGNYIEFVSDGNIFCSNGRGYVWDAINAKVRKGSGNDLSFTWDGRIVLGVDASSWFMFGDPQRRIRTDWTWSTNGSSEWIGIKVDTDGAANRGVPVNPCDARLKEVYGPSMVDALGALKNVPIVSFQYKSENPDFPIENPQTAECGFLAQDLQAVAPCAVFPVGDEQILHMSNVGMASYFIRAIQQLSEQVTQLKAEVETLKKAV